MKQINKLDNSVPPNRLIKDTSKEPYLMNSSHDQFARLFETEMNKDSNFSITGSRKIETSTKFTGKKPTEVWLG